MKTYCFNYAIEGVMTTLPLFICSESTNQFKAWLIARKYLAEKNRPKGVKVYFKNYPDAIDSKFGTSRIPKEFYNKP